jgi:ATP-dependent helicase HrpA
MTAPKLVGVVTDARAHLQRLVRPGFVTATGIDRLDDLHRYVKGIERRLERVGDDLGRDRRRVDEVSVLERRYAALLDRLPASRVTAEVRDLRWQIEELRISLFAQVLGTKGTVSAGRITKALAALEADTAR